MEDVTAEAGLSSGSMYLYFSTKDELIRAAIEGSLDEFEGVVAAVAASTAGSPAEFLSVLLQRVERFAESIEGVDLFRLALQGWAFAQTDELAAGSIRGSYARLRKSYESFVDAWLSDCPASARRNAADALAAQVTGFIVQRALVGQVTARQQARGTSLLATVFADRG